MEEDGGVEAVGGLGEDGARGREREEIRRDEKK